MEEFKQVKISPTEDGYWIDSFDLNGSGCPDIIAYGLNTGQVRWFENPASQSNGVSVREGDWRSHFIADIHQPVGMAHGFISNEEFEDIVISAEYGNTMTTINEEGGMIYLLLNPRGPAMNGSNKEWTKRYVGKAPGMHRLSVGYFTQTEKLEVLALPVVGKQQDTHSVITVKLFQQPKDIYTATEWKETVINDNYFHVIHDVTVRKFRSNLGDFKDSVLLASQEGITWLYCDEGKWQMSHIADGIDPSSEGGYWGCESVDVGRVRDDPFAYIACAGPFHGNSAMVYVKQKGTFGSIENCSWKRVDLNIFGNNNAPQRDGDGNIHHVVCADLDNDGNDEILYALRDEGVKGYKVKDIVKAEFEGPFTLSQQSAARITVADFKGEGKLDFATISYNVKGYYEAADPTIYAFMNPSIPKILPKSDGFVVSMLNPPKFEVNIVPDAAPPKAISLEVITVQHFKHHVVYMPALSSYSTPRMGTLVKVISGFVMIKPYEGSAPLFIGNTVVAEGSRDMTVQSDECKITATRETVLLVLEPTCDTIHEDFPLVTDVESISVSPIEINGKKPDLKFKDFIGETSTAGFYNMDGFCIRIRGLHLCYVQFWLADKKVSAGLHDHRGDEGEKAFCEIHFCVVNGTGQGAMYRSLTPPLTDWETAEKHLVKVLVPSGFEHGPLWVMDEFGNPMRHEKGSVVYPAHAWIAGKGDKRLDPAGVKSGESTNCEESPVSGENGKKSGEKGRETDEERDRRINDKYRSLDFWEAVELSPHIVKSAV